MGKKKLFLTLPIPPEFPTKRAKITNINFCNIFHRYFDIAFAIGMCPFRLANNSKTGKYNAVTWWPQLLLSILTNVLILFVYVGDLRFGYFNLEQKKKLPFNYFYYAIVLSKMLLAQITLWQMCFGRAHFSNLINFLVYPNNLLSPISKRITRVIKLVFLGNFILGCVGRRIIAGYVAFRGFTPYYLLSEYEWGRYLFLFDKVPMAYINATENYFATLAKTLTAEHRSSIIGLGLLSMFTKFCL